MALLALAIGCSEVRETQPARTATEQLLISTAADKAIALLDVALPPDAGIWFDTSHFDSYDEPYVVSAMKAHIAGKGYRLVPDRKEAEYVVEARSGALSIFKKSDLFGTPSFEIPIPLSGPLKAPELALIKHNEQVGIAKFALTSYEADTGRLVFNTGPVLGFAWRSKWSVVGIGWTTGDVVAPD